MIQISALKVILKFIRLGIFVKLMNVKLKCCF